MLPNLVHCRICYEANIVSDFSCRIKNKCYHRKALNLNKDGNLRLGRLKYTPIFKAFIHQARLSFSSIHEAVSEFQISSSKLQRVLSFCDIRCWPLEHSYNKAQKQGREAELFIKSLPDFRILRDCVKKNPNHPFDLVIQGYGAIDVKSTGLIHKTFRNKSSDFWSFSIGHLARQTKFVFLVAYNTERDIPLALFIIPKNNLCGIQTVHIMASPVRGKYINYLSKVFHVCEATKRAST